MSDQTQEITELGAEVAEVREASNRFQDNAMSEFDEHECRFEKLEKRLEAIEFTIEKLAEEALTEDEVKSLKKSLDRNIYGRQ